MVVSLPTVNDLGLKSEITKSGLVLSLTIQTEAQSVLLYVPLESGTHCQVEVLQEYFPLSATFPQLTVIMDVLFNLLFSVIALIGSSTILK